VEMAVVLVIAGLLISTAMAVGTVQISNNRILATKSKQAAIKSALITFIMRNNRLPCPAVPTLGDGDVGYGAEAAIPGSCTSVPNASGVSIGVVPWRALGLSSDGADDGYYHRFTYAVTTTQTALSERTVSGMRGSINIHNASPAASTNQTNNCTPSGWTYNPCSAVVVILSHGERSNGAYTSSGSRIDLPDATNTEELENTNIDNVFIDKDYSDSTVNSFNDIVLALDPEDLLLPPITSGAIKDYKAQIKKDYSLIVGAAATDALATRSGGAPGLRTYSMPATLSGLNLAAETTTDPWGMTYIYNRVTTTITSSTSNNIAFTITSYGPNGISGGGDDIVETVMVSDMQALFSTYGW
jgi:hypothetical protein